jgi:hypothetical protein
MEEKFRGLLHQLACLPVGKLKPTENKKHNSLTILLLFATA